MCCVRMFFLKKLNSNFSLFKTSFTYSESSYSNYIKNDRKKKSNFVKKISSKLCPNIKKIGTKYFNTNYFFA